MVTSSLPKSPVPSPQSTPIQTTLIGTVLNFPVQWLHTCISCLESQATNDTMSLSAEFLMSICRNFSKIYSQQLICWIKDLTNLNLTILTNCFSNRELRQFALPPVLYESWHLLVSLLVFDTAHWGIVSIFSFCPDSWHRLLKPLALPELQEFLLLFTKSSFPSHLNIMLMRQLRVGPQTAPGQGKSRKDQAIVLELQAPLPTNLTSQNGVVGSRMGLEIKLY